MHSPLHIPPHRERGYRSITGPPLRHGGADNAGYSARRLRGAKGHSTSAHPALLLGWSQVPDKTMENCKDEVDDTVELDLSNKRRIGRPSFLTRAKAAAFRTVNKQN